MQHETVEESFFPFLPTLPWSSFLHFKGTENKLPQFLENESLTDQSK